MWLLPAAAGPLALALRAPLVLVVAVLWATGNLFVVYRAIGSVQYGNTPRTLDALYAAIDQRWWPIINLYLVTWGQNVCRPLYPRCGACVVREYCPQIGVTRQAKQIASELEKRFTSKSQLFERAQ